MASGGVGTVSVRVVPDLTGFASRVAASVTPAMKATEQAATASGTRAGTAMGAQLGSALARRMPAPVNQAVTRASRQASGIWTQAMDRAARQGAMHFTRPFQTIGRTITAPITRAMSGLTRPLAQMSRRFADAGRSAGQAMQTRLVAPLADVIGRMGTSGAQAGRAFTSKIGPPLQRAAVSITSVGIRAGAGFAAEVVKPLSAITGAFASAGRRAGAAFSGAVHLGQSLAGRFRTAGDEAGEAFASGARSRVSGLAAGIGVAALAGAAVGLGSLTRAGLESAAAVQQTTASMTALYGSAEAAEDMMGRLSAIGAESPIESQAFLDAGQNLAYMGVQGETAEGVIRNIGTAITASGGTTEHLDRATEALLAMSSQGRLTANEVNQLSSTMVPAWDMLASHMGVSIAEVRDMVSAGTVEIDDMLAALGDGSGEYFANLQDAADASAQTFTATWARVKDDVVGQVGEALVPVLDQMAPVLDRLGEVAGGAIEGLLPLFTSVGAIVDALLPALEPLGALVGELATQLGGLLAEAVAALAPVVGELASALVPVVAALGDALMPIMEALAPIVGELIAAVVPLVVIIGDALAAAVAMLAPVLVQVLDAVSPLIPLLGDALMVILEALAPVFLLLVEVVAALLPALIPILPPIVELIGLLLQLITPVIQVMGALTSLLVGAITPLITAIVSLAATVVSKVIGVIVSAFNRFVGPTTKALGSVRRALSSFGSWASGFVSGIWSGMLSTITGVWNSVSSTTSRIWNGIKNTLSSLLSSIRSGFRTGVNAIGRVWDGLKNKAKTPVKWVIDVVYTGGIKKMWDAVAGKVGLSKLPAAPKLATGGIIPGYRPGHDSVPAVLSPGEAVLRPEVARWLGSETIHGWNSAARSGVLPGFAGGGIVGSITSSVGGFLSAASDLWTDGIRSAAEAVLNPMVAGARRVLGDTEWGSMIAGIPAQLVDKLLDWFGSQDNKLGGGPMARTAIRLARSQIGVPYSWGGGGPGGPSYGFDQGAGIRGFDCSSLMQYALVNAGVTGVPRVSQAQMSWVKTVSSPRPGDLGFPHAGHVWMATNKGGSRIVEAPRTGLNIRETAGRRAQKWGRPKYTALAEGGIVTRPLNALVGEAGAEAVMPLNRLADVVADGIVVGLRRLRPSTGRAALAVADLRPLSTRPTVPDHAARTEPASTTVNVSARTDADPYAIGRALSRRLRFARDAAALPPTPALGGTR